MNQNRFAGLAATLVVAVLTSLGSTNALAVTPACGTVLTTDTTLDSDMICPGIAVFFNSTSNNVELDCAGFSMSTTENRVISGYSAAGITIRNCNITTSHFEGRGMVLTAVTNATIVDNTIVTTGDNSRGIQLRGDSNGNVVCRNEVDTAGESSQGIRLEASANDNFVCQNTFKAEKSYALSVRSSSDNQLTRNTLISPMGFLQQNRHSLQNGGLSVDSGGTIFAVENNWGSSAGGGLGIGEATALFKVDPNTGRGHSVVQLLDGGADVGFGFDSLEIMPVSGRFIATPGSNLGTSQIYEINQNSGEVTALVVNNALPPDNVVGDINGLDAISETLLWATTNRGELATIDLNTMDMTLVGDQATGWTDIATHPTNGKTYVVSRRRDEASLTSHLYEIDTVTGAILAEIGDTGIYSISDIDFASDGTLYANYGLITININTGEGTVVAAGWFGGDPLEPLSQDNTMEDTVFQTEDGEILFSGSVDLPIDDETNITSDAVEIESNRARIDSTLLPFLDRAARVTLSGLSGDDRVLLVDEFEEGNFVECPETQCTLVSFRGGDLVFDVTGFSAYSSEEEDSGGGGLISPWLLAPLSGIWILVTGFRRRHFVRRA